MHKTYVIAEIGINYVVSLDDTEDYRAKNLETAKKLIQMAKVAGCDAVKFQKRNPDVCVPEHQKNVLKSTPWGDMTYLEYKKRVEFGYDEYDEIDRYCKELDITWSASVWDLDSLEFTRKYNLPWIKIPSALVTDNDLIVSSMNHYEKVIFSTGMCTEQEVQSLLFTIEEIRLKQIEYRKKHDYEIYDVKDVVMHCNSTYPASIGDLQLSYLDHLSRFIKTYDLSYLIDIGYSGHEFGLLTTIASVYLGAKYIERHITLDRTMWGTDQLSSVGPKGLIELVDGIRELERAYGDAPSARILTEGEKQVRTKLRP